MAANALRSIPMTTVFKFIDRCVKALNSRQGLSLLGLAYVFADDGNVNDGLINLAALGLLTASLPAGGSFTAHRGIQRDRVSQYIDLGGTWDADANIRSTVP